jgi:hypothetical protein
MMPRGALKIQIAFWGLRPTSTNKKPSMLYTGEGPFPWPPLIFGPTTASYHPQGYNLQITGDHQEQTFPYTLWHKVMCRSQCYIRSRRPHMNKNAWCAVEDSNNMENLLNLNWIACNNIVQVIDVLWCSHSDLYSLGLVATSSRTLIFNSSYPHDSLRF